MTRPDRQLRVLVVDPAPRGGLVHHSWVVCDALADQASVTLLAVRPYELADVPRSFAVETRLRPWPPRGGPAFAQRARSAVRALVVALANWMQILLACRRLRPDVLHFANVPTNHPSGQWWRPPFLDLKLFAIVRRLDAAIVTMIHDVPADRPTSGTAALIDASDGVISHRSLDDIDGARRTETEVLVVPHPPYTLIANLASPAPSPSFAGRWPEGARVVSHAGYIETYKGTDLAIEAFAKVSTDHPDAWLVVAGEESEPAFGRHCRELIEQANLTRVVYEPRFLDIAELGWLLESSTVAALPYRRLRKSAASGVAYAALACGARVVVSSEGAFEDVIDDPGVEVVPPDDVDALASAIGRALDLGRLQARPSDWSGAVADVMKLYATAVDAAATRRRGSTRVGR
jgi:glycosyltransferase involved in cell wall biosynthesis